MHYHVYGLGNALVDMEYEIDDAFLAQHEIAKGHMTLVEAERLLQLSGDLADHAPRRCSGGSAANSLMAVSALGAGPFTAARWLTTKSAISSCRTCARPGSRPTPMSNGAKA